MTSTYLVTGNAAGIVVAGAESNLYLQTQNTSGSAITVSLSYSLMTVDGAVQSFGTSKSCPAGGTVNFPISIAGQPYGHRWVTFSASGSGYNETNVKHGFCYAPQVAGQATDTTGFAWGMNLGFGPVSQDWAGSQQIGITHVRSNYEWTGWEYPAGNYNWGPVDSYISTAEAYGMAVMWMFAYEHAGDAFRSPPTTAAYAGGATQLANRYGTRIKWYELWNEPNNTQFWTGNAAQYVAIMKAAYTAIKAVNSSLLVGSAGFAGANLYAPIYNGSVEQQTLLNSTHFDIHMSHPHGDFAIAEADMAAIASWRAAEPVARPIFFNEIGIDTPATGYSHLQQASETVKKIALARAIAIGYTIYEYADQDTNATQEPEKNFGLTTSGRQPKPVVGAISQAIYRLRSRSYWGTLAGLASGVRLYIYHGASDYLTIFWNQNGGTVAPVLLECGTGATAFDMWGNSITLPAGTSTQKSATFGPNPLYLVSTIAPYIAGTTPGPGPGDPGTGDPGPGPTTVSDTVTALLPFSRMRADVRTEASGQVTAFQDLSRSGHTYTATGTKIAAIIGSGTLAGRALAVFTGTQTYASSLAGSSWSFLHQNHAHEIFVVLVSTVTSGYADIISTVPSSQVASYQLFSNATTGAITSAVYGAATQYVSCSSPALADGSPVFLRVHSDLSLAPQESMTTNEATTDGQYYGFTPSTATTNATLSIGDGTGAFAIAELIIFDRTLREDERAVVIAYVSNYYGIPAYTDYVSGISPFARFRADKRAENGGKVTEFRDLRNSTHRLLQTDTTKQVAAVLPSALLNNRELALFTGTQKYVSTYTADSWNFLHQDRQKEIFLVVCAINNGSYNNMIVTTADYVSSGMLIYTTPTGGIVVATGFGAAQQQGPSSANFTADTPVVIDYQGHQVVDNPDFLLAANSNTDVIGNFTFTPVGTNATLTLTLGDTPGDSMKFAELIIFDRLLTPSERAGVRQYIATYYGIAASTYASVTGGCAAVSTASASMRFTSAIAATILCTSTATLKRNFFQILDLSTHQPPSTFSDSPAEMKSGRWSVIVTPSQSSAASFATFAIQGIFALGDTGDEIYLLGSGGYVQLRAVIGGVSYTNTGDGISYTAGMPLTITVDTGAATMTVSGAITGNLVTSLGSPFTFQSGTLYVGRRSFAGSYNFIGSMGNVQSYYGGAPGAVASVVSGAHATTVGALINGPGYTSGASFGVATTVCAMRQAVGGTTVSSSNGVATLIGRVPIGGTTSAVSSTSASWTARYAFSGSSTAVAVATGAAVGRGALTGASSGVATPLMMGALGTPIGGSSLSVASAPALAMLYRINLPCVPSAASASAVCTMGGPGAMAGVTSNAVTTVLPNAARGAMAGASSGASSIVLFPGAATGANSLSISSASATAAGPGAMLGVSTGVGGGVLNLAGARYGSMSSSAGATPVCAIAGSAVFSLGQVTCGSAITGSVAALGSMAGATVNTTSTACSLGSLGAVAGASSAASATAGATRGTGALLPTSAGVASVVASGRQAVGGTSSATAATACTLGGLYAASGASSGLSLATSSLVAQGALAGASAGASGASLTMGGSHAALATTSAVSSVACVGTAGGAVVGSCAGASTTLCNGSAIAYGTGVTAGACGATAILGGAEATAGTTAGAALTACTISGGAAMAAVSTNAASTTCALGGATTGVYASGGTSTVTGSPLIGRGNLLPVSSGVSAARATMSGRGALAGVSSGRAGAIIPSIANPKRFSHPLVTLVVPSIR